MDPTLLAHARAAIGFMPDEEGLALHEAGLTAAAAGTVTELRARTGERVRDGDALLKVSAIVN